MRGICDGVLDECPDASLSLFVDDIALQVTGNSEAEVEQQLESSVSRCIADLEVGLGLVVSRGKDNSKTVFLHSAMQKKGRQRLAKAMARMGVKGAQQTKLLGVDFSAGKKVKRSVQRKRISKMSGRRKRYRQLGKKTANHVLKTGGGPGMRYGAAAYGATDSAIKLVRSFSCNAVGEMRGKSTFARIALAGHDAGGLMAIDPIIQWAKAVWDGLVVRDDMAFSWKVAMRDVATAQRPFSAVRGPAGAMVASARRIG